MGLLPLGLSDNLTPKCTSSKEEVDALDLSEIQNFYAAKSTVKKVKREATEWEKMFTDPISDKGLVSRVYEERLELSNKRQHHLKMEKGSE